MIDIGVVIVGLAVAALIAVLALATLVFLHVPPLPPPACAVPVPYHCDPRPR